MKKLKKILAAVVSAALLVSALAIPTEATITTTPTTKSKSGTYKVGNRTYSYGGTLTASTTQVKAAASSGSNLTLRVEVKAYGSYLGEFTLPNSNSDAIAGKSVSALVNNRLICKDGVSRTCDISYAYGQYTIGAIDSFLLSMP